MERRLTWLRKRHAYCRAVRYAEMTCHRFPNRKGMLQRVEFDLEQGLCRVDGVEGFTGDWKAPEIAERQEDH